MLAALVLVATSAGAEIRGAPAYPRPVPLVGLPALALATDTMWVGRFRGPTTPSTRVALDVVPRLRAILLRARRVDVAHGIPEICGSCPDQLPIVISVGTQSSGANRLDLLVWFREAQLRYADHDGWVAMFSVRDDAPELLALVKRTLPGDSIVQRYEWHPRPDSLPLQGSPGDEGNPKFGEYVYVEELPEAIVKVPPEYPAEARKMGVDGTVMVQALVDRSGNISDTRVIKSIPLLDNAAVAAVRQWKFKPAMSKGNPVAVWVAVPIRFTLH
jgi:TonB family protein